MKTLAWGIMSNPRSGEYRRLESGAWGAWIFGPYPKPGDVVLLTAMNGQTCIASVQAIVRESATGALVSLEGMRASKGRPKQVKCTTCEASYSDRARRDPYDNVCPTCAQSDIPF